MGQLGRGKDPRTLTKTVGLHPNATMDDEGVNPGSPIDDRHPIALRLHRYAKHEACTPHGYPQRPTHYANRFGDDGFGAVAIAARSSGSLRVTGGLCCLPGSNNGWRQESPSGCSFPKSLARAAPIDRVRPLTEFVDPSFVIVGQTRKPTCSLCVLCLDWL